MSETVVHLQVIFSFDFSSEIYRDVYFLKKE